MVNNIWTEGYEIVRDGIKIKLTREELREINESFKAANGKDSVQYFLGTLWDDEDSKYESIAKELLEDAMDCACIWDNFLEDIFYESGSLERDAVRYYINSIIEKRENEREGNR